jgi:hypothetical protein
VEDPFHGVPRPVKTDIEAILFTYYTNTACSFDFRLYLTPLGQTRQFIDTSGTSLCKRKFALFWACLLFLPV